MTEKSSSTPSVGSTPSNPEMDRNKLILRVAIGVVVLFFVGLVAGRAVLALGDSDRSQTQIDVATAASDQTADLPKGSTTSNPETPGTTSQPQGSTSTVGDSDGSTTSATSADESATLEPESPSDLAVTLTPSATVGQQTSGATASTSAPRTRVTAAASPTTTNVPATTPPATTPPVTQAPTTTKAPTTTPPVTQAPTTTKAPATTKAPTTTNAPTTTAAPKPTVSIGGGNQLTVGQQFFWAVSSTNAVSGTWSSSCGVANPNWSPGDGWGGSYDTPATCTLSLTVRNSAGQTATANKNFTIVAG